MENFLITSYRSRNQKFAGCLYGNRSPTKLKSVIQRLRLPEFVTSPYRPMLFKDIHTIKDYTHDGRVKLFVGEELIRRSPYIIQKSRSSPLTTSNRPNSMNFST